MDSIFNLVARQPESADITSDSPSHAGVPESNPSLVDFRSRDAKFADISERILAVQEQDISSKEKSRLTHSILNRGYNLTPRPHSPSLDSHSNELPPTPESSRSTRALGRRSLSSTSTGSISGSPYYLSPEDFNPTFYYQPPIDDEVQQEQPLESHEDITDEDDGSVILGCLHYKRNVKVQCFTCKKWYPCRFCHDAAEPHALDRRKTENMLCMLCHTPQPAGQWCRSCGDQAAFYYCSICKLWDNDSLKNIYHCDDCGICRLGQGIGKDFIHCQKCSACIPIAIQDSHRCIELSVKSDCPICGEFMFTSPIPVVFMRCGHSIHEKCFADYSRISYRCPLCFKTVRNMETSFRNLDRTIRSQPMPTEFKDTHAIISCNDCRAKSVVPYHWLGLKCEVCESYNTVQTQLLNSAFGIADTPEGRQDPGVGNNQGLSVPIPGSSNDQSSRHGARNSLNATSGQALSIDTSRDNRGAQARSLPHSSFLGGYGSYRAQPKSPVVTNYFEMSRRDEAEKPPSRYSVPVRLARGSFSGFNFWSGMSIKERLGLTGGSDGEAEHEGNSEGEEAGDYDNDNDDDDIDDDDDDDESPDSIDIFGHR